MALPRDLQPTPTDLQKPCPQVRVMVCTGAEAISHPFRVRSPEGSEFEIHGSVVNINYTSRFHFDPSLDGDLFMGIFRVPSLNGSDSFFWGKNHS